MIKINLLPWREELRKQKQQNFINALAVSVVAVAGIFIGIHFYIADLQDYQTQRNNLLQNEITLLDKQIIDIKNIEEQKTSLINKITVIHNLQQSRPEIVHLFNEIPRTVPDGLFIMKLTRTGRNLVFEGKAQTNDLVSAFMSRIDDSPWLQTPALDVIKSPNNLATEKGIGEEEMSDFTLRTQQSDLPDVKKTDK
ncbi:MAG: PilN domain-containing protein [Methylococcaceae bacterium]